jgi:hypothetical protein
MAGMIGVDEDSIMPSWDIIGQTIDIATTSLEVTTHAALPHPRFCFNFRYSEAFRAPVHGQGGSAIPVVPPNLIPE